MCYNLEQAYIPGCTDCQQNKGSIQKLMGPLRPLSIPDNQGNSMSMDFIGPFPEDRGFNCIVTFIDHLNSNVWVIPTHMDISAKDLAVLFFNKWYCKNSLPLDIVSNHDKLFISKFWQALHSLMGVKLKLSTAYYPESDGVNERSNKTINQWYCPHYTGDRTIRLRMSNMWQNSCLSTIAHTL
jgi:hypothetical protein